MGIITVIAITVVAGYKVYTSQNDMNLSNLAMANVEALAQSGESSDGNCESSTSRECCVCNGVHYTYQASVNRYCSTPSYCDHWSQD